MVNAKKGQVAATLDGKPVTLSLSFNALCELEDHFGEPVLGVLNRMGATDTPKLTDLRAVFWAAMLEHRPESTQQDAGRLLHESGMDLFEKLIRTNEMLSEEPEEPPADAPGN